MASANIQRTRGPVGPSRAAHRLRPDGRPA
jgi:hypothetical protein